MAYIALYRKWRPTGFGELVGQEHISETLTRAIERGKVAHAYMFTGPRGTGKTSTAKILAKGLNCLEGPTPNPCNKCPNCQKINSGSSMDVFEIDAASNRGIDEIRGLRETVKFAPTDGKYKIYIIDEVHMLTTEAFNALLKTLEEPPAHVIFILATTEAHKVPATIQSRCQRYDFKRIGTEDIQNRLALVCENIGIKAEKEALALLAMRAEGGMRDALGLLDQCLADERELLTGARVRQLLGMAGKEWVDAIATAIKNKAGADILRQLELILAEGKALQQLLGELVLLFRELLVFKATGGTNSCNVYGNEPDLLRRQGAAFSEVQLMKYIRRLHEALAELKWSPQPRITVEAALLELCQPEVGVPLSVAEGKESGYDSQRINKLEADIAKLTALLQTATLNKAPAKEEPNSPVEQAVAKKPDIIGKNNNELKKILLQDVTEHGSLPMKSCLEQCAVLRLDDQGLELGCPKAFVKNMLERTYLSKLKESLLRITGKEGLVKCHLGQVEEEEEDFSKADIQDNVPLPTDEDYADSSFQDLNQVERDRMQNAINVFGGRPEPL